MKRKWLAEAIHQLLKDEGIRNSIARRLCASFQIPMGRNGAADFTLLLGSGHTLGFISMQTEPLHSTSGTTDVTRRLPLSIGVATTKPWPEICAYLDSLLKQANAVGAEILVADGHGRGLLDEGRESYKGVIWLIELETSVFGLRKLGMRQARGELIDL